MYTGISLGQRNQVHSNLKIEAHFCLICLCDAFHSVLSMCVIVLLCTLDWDWFKCHYTRGVLISGCGLEGTHTHTRPNEEHPLSLVFMCNQDHACLYVCALTKSITSLC